MLALILLPLVLIGLSVPAAAEDALHADLDRQRLSLGETLNLRLTASGSPGGEPDLAPLLADFDLLGRARSTRMSIVNGVISHTIELRLELAPKRAGRLQVPALTWGQARSDPLAVEVAESAAADAADAADGSAPALFVEAELDTPEPYVQQSLVYRVRVVFRDEPQRASLSDPRADGAILERDGEDRASTRIIDGQRHGVIERRYLATPQRSGPILIEGPRLDATVLDTRSPGRPVAPGDLDAFFGGPLFQGFTGRSGISRRVVARAPDLELRVRPQPSGSALPWLPARSVQLTDEWMPAAPTLKVGEPVTRTVTLTAEGVTAAQLPPLELAPPAAAGVQSYPDQPVAETLPGASGVPAAVQRVRIALVPTAPGTLTLPEIRVPWWDTQADAPRVAVIPARTFEVLPAPGASVQASAASAASGSPGADAADAAAGSAERAPPSTAGAAGAGSESEAGDAGAGRPETAGDARSVDRLDPWPWLALLFGLGWLGTLIRWRRERRGRGSDRSMTGGTELVANAAALRAARDRIRDACRISDPRAVRQALLDWAERRWPLDPPPGLQALAARLAATGAAGRPDLEALDRLLYAPSGADWDGSAYWRLLEPALRGDRDPSRAPRPSDLALPALYPGARGESEAR